MYMYMYMYICVAEPCHWCRLNECSSLADDIAVSVYVDMYLCALHIYIYTNIRTECIWITCPHACMFPPFIMMAVAASHTFDHTFTIRTALTQGCLTPHIYHTYSSHAWVPNTTHLPYVQLSEGDAGVPKFYHASTCQLMKKESGGYKELDLPGRSCVCVPTFSY